MKEDISLEIEIPEGVQVQLDGTIKVTGPQGEVEKKLVHPRIKIKKTENKIVMESLKATKTEKKIVYAFRAHLKHMFSGVQEKHVYKIKICSGHFPMNVAVSNNQLIIKNFIGENTPRKLNLKPGVDVKVDGDHIIITSASKELAGQVAADIEQLTKVTNKDIRIFQDGCYIIEKAGKVLDQEK